MALRERLVYAIDIVTEGATRGIKGFRQAIREADTTTGKFKAAGTAAFSQLKAHAGTLALGLGTGLVTAGIKASKQFTELALAAEKMALATSQSTEDASRWIEVAGDIGISTEQIQGGFVRLEKAIGSNSPAIQALGLELVRTSDGAVDMSATMLNAIDVLGSVEDPALKAKYASEIFGRGFADMAELVLGDAKAIRRALDDVSESKIIDAEEVAKAKKNRETLDELKDTVEDLSLAFGESFLPVIKGAAEGLQALNRVASTLHLDDILGVVDDFDAAGTKIGHFLRSLADAGAAANFALVDQFNASEQAAQDFDRTLLNGLDTFEEVRAKVLEVTDSQHAANVVALEWKDAQEQGVEATEESTNVLGSMSDKLKAMRAAYDQSTSAIEMAEKATDDKRKADERAAEEARRHRDALREVARAMEEQQNKAIALVGGDIAVRDAQRDAADAAEELNEVLKDQDTTLREAGAAIDEAAEAQLRAAEAATDYAVQQAEANGQTVDAETKAFIYKQELQKLADQLDGPLREALQRYIDELGRIPTDVTTNLRVITRQGDTGQTRTTARQHGGPVEPGQIYRVNETGTELLHENGRTYLLAGQHGRVEPLQKASSPVGPRSNSVVVNMYGPTFKQEADAEGLARRILFAMTAAGG